MAKPRYNDFTKFTPEGREFIKMWNSAYRRGIQKKLSEHFCISIATVYRIRKELNLPDLHGGKHPGVSKFNKRVIRLYHKERSTIQIAKIVKMSEEIIRRILIENNVEIRPQYVTNSAYFKTKSHLTPHQLLQEIKRLYIDERLPASRIARNLHIDQGTVRTKLHAMGIQIEHRKIIREAIMVVSNYNIKGIYLGTSEPFIVFCFNEQFVRHVGRSMDKRKTANCQWCSGPFKQYIDSGPRTQKFCGSRCSNQGKDFRRMLKGDRFSPTRFAAMERELKEAWGDRYEEARCRILDVNPAISKNKLKVMKTECPTC